MKDFKILDILAFGAHPDDVEVGAGGLLYKWIQQGKRVGIADLSQGESSSNGTLAIRQVEADNAGQILGVMKRINLGMPCGFIQTSEETIRSVISVIRTYKPKVILAPYWKDRHSDHIETSTIVSRAVFRSGMHKIETGQTAHKPEKLFHYMLHHEFEPSFVVDISEEFKVKMRSIKAHASQFNRTSQAHQTHINNGNFLDFIEARAKFYGFKTGVDYGEPYVLADSLLGVDDPFNLFTKSI